MADRYLLFLEIPMTDFIKTWKNWIAGGGITVAVGLILWGVPHFIANTVSSAVASEITAREILQGKSVDITNLEAQNATIIAELGAMKSDISEVKGSVIRVEDKQGEFGQIFMEYLSRE